MYESFNFFIISPLVSICPFDYSQSNECECYLLVVLICRPLISRDIEHLFICFWPFVHLLWRTVYSDPAMFWMFVSPQNAYVENIMPNILGEPLRIRSWGKSHYEWLVPFKKKASRRSFTLSAICGYNEKSEILKWVLNWPCEHTYFGLSASRTVYELPSL